MAADEPHGEPNIARNSVLPNGILLWQTTDWMETKLDKFGRIVIPKAVREALALDAGDELELNIVEDEHGRRSLTLRASHEQAPFRRKGKLLVFTGKLTDSDLDVVDHIREIRDERTGYLSGRE